jgi:TRAP-type mannitol/chloroaromatic compound transport system substrate-binding protein
MYAWLFAGNGLELWTDLYADFGIIPIPAGNTGAQMGGWFNREIRSIDDFDGLKMRIPGLGGRVISELGGSAVLLPGGEIYTSLERGVIDATEWIGPYHDELMGFQNVVKNYYYPGWHEPGTVLELAVNRDAWEELPSDIRQIVRSAAFESRNQTALEKLIREDDVQVRQFPSDVIAALKRTAEQVIDELVSGDPKAAKIYDSFQAFKANVGSWGRLSEQSFYNLIQHTDSA